MKLHRILVGIFTVAFFMGVYSPLSAQNYVMVPSGADEATILELAASVRPSERQMAWQELEYYGFIHLTGLCCRRTSATDSASRHFSWKCFKIVDG